MARRSCRCLPAGRGLSKKKKTRMSSGTRLTREERRISRDQTRLSLHHHLRLDGSARHDNSYVLDNLNKPVAASFVASIKQAVLHPCYNPKRNKYASKDFLVSGMDQRLCAYMSHVNETAPTANAGNCYPLRNDGVFSGKMLTNIGDDPNGKETKALILRAQIEAEDNHLSPDWCEECDYHEENCHCNDISNVRSVKRII